MQEISLPGETKAIFTKELAKARLEAEQIVVQSDVRQEPQEIAPNDPYLELAEKYPEAAVLEAYKPLEILLTGYPGDKDRKRYNSADVIYSLGRKGYIPESVKTLYDRVRKLRNAAVHAGSKTITPGEAIEYRDLVKDLVRHIDIGLIQEEAFRKKNPPTRD